MAVLGAGDRWGDAARWSRGALRREVSFVRSGPFLVYRSLYAPARSTADRGAILCPSWGHELAVSLDLLHLVARGLARRGGAAVVVHPPGHGDSSGTIGEATVPLIVRSAVDAATEVGGLLPGLRWAFCGVRFGAATAALARAALSGGMPLVAIQPALDPAAYLDDAVALGRRLARAGGGRAGRTASEAP